MKKTTAFLKSFSSKNIFLIFILIIILFLLRIPNFYEPYWYGDEAIYLSVGNGLNNDLKLYTDIVDHKTPIIYYLARTPSQFGFRVLTLGWMMATTVLFFCFSKRLLNNKNFAFIASIIFVLLTTLPPFEGNIPNGEMFVMGFVMLGALLFSHTRLFKQFISSKKLKGKQKHGVEHPLLFFSGVFFSLGILTKVPGLLDLAVFLSVSWFTLTNSFSQKKREFKAWKKLISPTIIKTFILMLGVIAPIIMSIIYFVSIGSGKDYLDYGLLYNLRYSGSWRLAFENELLIKAFTLPGKTLLLTVFMLLLTFGRKLFSTKFQFIAAWFGLTLFATLLSNRPYPHYFIQTIPALSLLVAYSLSKVIAIIKNPAKNSLHTAEVALAAAIIFLGINILIVMDVGLYPTVSYYSKFHQLISKQITKDEYDRSFNHLVEDNKKITKLIKELGINEIFIWGTNPMLYAKSQTVPSSRYTVAFHIKDFDAYDETFKIIEKNQPKIIVVMKDEQNSFPALNNYINQNYLPGSEYDHMILYFKEAR